MHFGFNEKFDIFFDSDMRILLEYWRKIVEINW